MARLLLINMGCHTVEEEVPLNRLGLTPFTGLDNKKVIDVLGVGLRYREPETRGEGFEGFDLGDPQRYLFGYNVLRGVEVKVSRSDYRNGFVCSGCNYNYVLTPTRLVSSRELPRGVGLVEFNRYKFSCGLREEGEARDGRPFNLSGLRVVRRPSYRRVPQFQVDHVVAEVARRRVRYRDVFDDVMRCLGDPELIYREPGSGSAGRSDAPG